MESESIITDLIINDNDYREIELVLTNEGMYLPSKFFFEMFEIPIEQNHLEKSISGKGLSGKSFLINSNKVFIDGKKFENKVFYVKEGLLPDTRDEFFIEADFLSKITQGEIASDIDNLVVYLTSDKFVTIAQDSKSILSGKKEPRAYEDVSFPDKKDVITLDSIEFKNNATSDVTSQAYQDKNNTNFMFNNNTNFILRGKLNSGDYKIDMASNNYTGEIFSFNGLGVQYKNKYDKYDYTLGKLDPWLFNSLNVTDDIFGFSISDRKEQVKNYRNIEGFVDKKSLVKVRINDDFEQVIDTYGGYYSLKDVYYNSKRRVEQVRIEEVLPDKTTKIVLEKNFRKDPDRFLKGEIQHDFIAGYSGLQNRLWSNNGYIYESNTKKFVTGGKYKVGISDKLTFENFYLTDKIVSMPKNYTWGESLILNRNYLNFYTLRNPNVLEGQTYMGLFDYKINDKADAKLLSGLSNSMSMDSSTVDGRGMAVDLQGDYKFSDKQKLSGNVYFYSPDFYLAGSSGGSASCKSDRIGASIRGNTDVKKASIDTSVSLYNTNLNDFYQGGAINFNEYAFNARVPFEKLPSLNFRYKTKKGANNLGEITSDSFEASAIKSVGKNVRLEAGIRDNAYSNYYAANGFSGYKSSYSNIYANMNYRLPKNLGNLELKHEAVETKSDDNKDSYNVIRAAYTFPVFKRFSLNTSTGYHYTGMNKGFDFGAGLMYRMKSGSAVSLNYRFNRAPGYLVDSMFLPSNMRHYVTLDFSEVFGVSDGNLYSVGMNDFDKGYVEAVAFLDVNRNGKLDEGEVMIEGVPIQIAQLTASCTNYKGSTGLSAVQEGVHNVKIYEDELPAFLSFHSKTNPKQVVKVEPTQKTKVYFGMLSSVGNISGKVQIKDEYGRNVPNGELIVVVQTKDGEEVGYTTVMPDGTYAMSGVPPGEYLVMVDKDYQAHYRISPNKDTVSKMVEIPPEYQKFVDVKNVDLNYTYKLVPTI